MNVESTPLPGVFVFEPVVRGDDRGFFIETFRASTYAEYGIPEMVQHNQSRSAKGVLRGVHFQLVQPQGKLVRVARGEVFDVAVDIRVGSPTFGAWFGVVLDDRAHRQMYIPPNFGHAFAVLSEVADFHYLCTDYYHPGSEATIAPFDPEIAILWPEIDTPWQLSDKDTEAPALSAIDPARLPKYIA